MRFYAGIERRCTQVTAGARWHVGTDVLPKQGVCGGSRGSVFQTGLPWGKDSGGLKTPAIKRPSYGRGCKDERNLCVCAEALYAVLCGY